jgi:hypothetical protein
MLIRNGACDKFEDRLGFLFLGIQIREVTVCGERLFFFFFFYESVYLFFGNKAII